MHSYLAVPLALNFGSPSEAYRQGLTRALYLVNWQWAVQRQML